MIEAPSYTLKFANTIIAKLADVLFPNSPIEVRYEDQEFHLFCEGEWCQAECDEPGLIAAIAEITARYRDDWRYPSTRIAPTWVGWLRLEHLRFDNDKQA
jgi:hypothetical protein